MHVCNWVSISKILSLGAIIIRRQTPVSKLDCKKTSIILFLIGSVGQTVVNALTYPGSESRERKNKKHLLSRTVRIENL